MDLFTQTSYIQRSDNADGFQKNPDQISKEHMHSNSFYMILNNNFYSNDKLMVRKHNHAIYDNFHRIRCYGFTGRNNLKIDYKNITLYFCGVIYNYDEIIQKCLPDIKEFVKLQNGHISLVPFTKCSAKPILVTNLDFNSASFRDAALKSPISSEHKSKTMEDDTSDNVFLEFEEFEEFEDNDYSEDFENDDTESTTTDDDSMYPSFKNQYELIIFLYIKYGIEYTLQLIDGEFAMVLMDDNLQDPETTMFVARDRMGIQPLYMLSENSPVLQKSTKIKSNHELIANQEDKCKVFGFSTSLSFLSEDLNETDETRYTIVPFAPGSYSKYSIPFKVLSSWKLENEFVKYSSLPTTQFIFEKSKFLIKTKFINILQNIRTNLSECIVKKINMINNTKNIACLLSGGIDSSIMTALICEFVNMNNKINSTNVIVETFCVGFIGSDDIKYAKIAADYLGTKHTEIIINENEYMQAIPHVIQILETYDTATVRAGVAQYLACKYINNYTNHDHVFTGDGADELMGGYLYIHAASNMFEFDREARNLLNNYHTNYGHLKNIFDFFNMKKHSPFLDQQFINFYLTIPLEFRYPDWSHDFFVKFDGVNKNYSEKYILRLAYSNEHYKNHNYSMLLPHEILWRPKEDFFDGIRNYPNSTRYMIARNLHSYISLQDNLGNSAKESNVCKTLNNEQQYYYDIFENFYNIKMTNPIWRLKYVVPSDEPSAHILDFYFDYNPEYKDRSL